MFLVKNRGGNFWCLPGGKVDGDETIQDALAREIVEELGIQPVIGPLLYVQQLNLKDTQRIEFYFKLENASDFTSINLAKTTHGHAELDAAEFKDPRQVNLLPEFLAAEIYQTGQAVLPAAVTLKYS
jgi:8-oxo-dGTP pyrophosphatase MutT (NUDIX family)